MFYLYLPNGINTCFNMAVSGGLLRLSDSIYFRLCTAPRIWDLHCTSYFRLTLLDLFTDCLLFVFTSKQMCPCWSLRNPTKSLKKRQGSPLKILSPQIRKVVLCIRYTLKDGLINCEVKWHWLFSSCSYHNLIRIIYLRFWVNLSDYKIFKSSFLILFFKIS